VHNVVNVTEPLRAATRPTQQSARLPISRSVTLAHVASLTIAGLMAVVSAAGLAFGSLYAADAVPALGIAASTAGVLVPGLRAHDAFNLLVGLPLLVGAVWLARRGSLPGLLLWPGALYYVLYTYAIYLVGAPFGPLFLAYVALVALSAVTTIGLIASVDGEAVRQRIGIGVPARTIGGLLVGLALLTVAQDAFGVIASTLGGGPPIEPVARRVWTADLALEVPSVLAGGVLLWRRSPLGYVVGAGLLFQFGLTPVALAAILAVQPRFTGGPMDVGTIVGVLVFAAICFASVTCFVRGAVGWSRTDLPQRRAELSVREGE
jgi:hypothetical protein